MYAIVSTGGKQYRVERGQTLLVERLPVDEGASCTLKPLLYVDGDQVLDSSQDGSPVRVEARVVAHERGPKLRVVKFKPKRGYKRRTGHRQELTRIEITAIEAGERPRKERAKKDASSSRPVPEREGARSASQPAQAGRTRGGRASEGGQAGRGRSASAGGQAGRGRSASEGGQGPSRRSASERRGRSASGGAKATPETKEENDGS